MAGLETVTIGCKLPAGLRLEVGYEIVKNRPDSVEGKMVRGANYATYIIRGWNHHSHAMRKQLIEAKSSMGVPHGLDTRPFLNRGVPKALWDEWVRKHPDSWLLRNKLLFVAADERSAAMQVAESGDTPKVFEPIDSKKTIVPDIKKFDPDEV